MSHYYRLPVFFLFLLITALAYGQQLQGQQLLRFEYLSTAQGLSHNRLFCIYQDRQGFMWFGTDNGLNRYDGYSFTVYKPDPGDPNNHMAHSTVWDMLESRTGEIWFVTPGGGLHRLDKHTGRINFFRVEPEGSNRFASYDICYTILEDKEGYFWIGSEGGLARFDPRTKQYRLYNLPVAPGTDDRVWSLVEDRFGTLWVGTSNGLFTMNRHTGQFRPYYFGPGPAEKQPIIESMYLGADNSLWIATHYKGLYRLMPRKRPLPDQSNRSTTYVPTGRVYLDNMEIMPHGLAEDEHHNLMVGTKWGLIRLDPKTGQSVTYLQDPNVAGSLSHNVVWALLADNRGTFWIGTANGIDRYSMLKPQFALYQPIPDHNATPRSENQVTTLAADGQGNIWFSNTTRTYVEDLFRMNLSDRRMYLNFTAQALTPTWLTQRKQLANAPANITLPIHCDQSGRIWMATPMGLQTVDANGEVRQYPAGFPVSAIADDKGGRKAAPPPTGRGVGLPKRLWVGGLSNLALFDPSSGRYTSYRIDKDIPIGKGGGQINDILVSRAGDVWVTVGGVGACRFDRRTGRFRSYHPSPVKNHKIFYSRDVTALSETADGAIWASTNIGGLFRIDPKTGAVSTFTIHDGLPDNHVVALITDQLGMLWLATGNELCRLDPVTRRLQVFDERDGLLTQGFTGARTRTPMGELAFGCTNGFVVFRPQKMGGNPNKPPVYINEVKVLDSTRLFPTSPLTLAYQDNVLSFNFVGLNYITPEKNQYAYQLDGVNPEWVYCGTQRTATYSFLAPGEYVFRVKASNNNGIWNEQGAAIRLVILPPWWRTWWAYVLYVFLIALSVWALVRYRSRQLRRANQRLEQTVALRTEEVLHQKEEIETQRNHLADALTELKDTQAQLIHREKLASLGELTAGIAHEIQNPLNFVNNYSDVSADLVRELEDEQKKEIRNTELEVDLLVSLKQNLQKISNHGNRASSIVKGMLEHSRTGGGERYPVDLNALVNEYLRLAYHGQRARNPLFNCTLVHELQPDLGKVNLVGKDFSRVLLNLFNNAFYALHQHKQHAPADYEPTLTVRTKAVGGAVEIQVSDNGIGIPDALKAKIFQPFFTTKPTGEGTGLGLSLSYDIIVNGHGGTLTVKSQEGEGSTFIIRLPSRK